MYIYDPKFSGAPSLSGPSITSQPGQRDSYYLDRGVAGFMGRGGSSGSYVWANDGIGEAVPLQSNASRAKAQVLVFQESLNKWRAVNGNRPIQEDGILGPETRKAVLEFQIASGLKGKDGIVGPATRERLKILLDILKNIPSSPEFSAESLRLIGLVGSPGFGSLDGPTQTDVLKQIASYEKPGMLDNIKHLTNLVTQTGFVSVPPASQLLMLRLLAARPDDEFLASHLSLLARSTGFRNLAEGVRTWVLKRIELYAGNRNKIGNLVNLITNTIDFDQLSQKSQNAMLIALGNHADDFSLMFNLRRAASRTDFRELPQPTQTEVISRIVAYPKDLSSIDNLLNLVTTPGFGDLGIDVTGDVLDRLPFRFGDVVLSNAGIGNMMHLLTAPGFSKLLREIRNFILDVQAARPDNAQLANALRVLAESPVFRNDHRLAKQTILKVNDSIP